MIRLFRDTEFPDTGGGPTKPAIPQEVKDKIEGMALIYASTKVYGGTMFDGVKYTSYEVGAMNAYSLALPEIQAQEERIRVLEEANKGLTSALAEAIQMSTDLVKTIKES